jgi:hypothetical protein
VRPDRSAPFTSHSLISAVLLPCTTPSLYRAFEVETILDLFERIGSQHQKLGDLAGFKRANILQHAELFLGKLRVSFAECNGGPVRLGGAITLHLSFGKSWATVPMGKKSRFSIFGNARKPYFL